MMSDVVMRLRAVLAGFVDMTPDDVATTAQQVADELLRERKRREEAERDRDAVRAERDRAAGEALNLDIAWAAMKDRAERAEADNAAFLQSLEAAGHALSCGMGERAVAGLLRQACRPHPGAAILERMTHLGEKVEEFARYANEAHAALDEAGLSAGGLTVAARLRNMLERMRALEAWVHMAVHGFRNLVEVGALGGGYADEATRLADDGLRALKPETK
jgi:hypothetical protein